LLRGSRPRLTGERTSGYSLTLGREPLSTALSGYPELFREACKKAGIEDYIRPFHDMRHTAITNLVPDAPNVAILSELAGHADMHTTQRYIHQAGTLYPALAASLSDRYGLAVQSEDES
jgi:integrase